MTSYRQTFRRHRRLLLLPVGLATFFALWSVLGSPKSYRSTASLWVDNPPGAESSVANTNPALPSPAELEQFVIQELLKTRRFTLTVGRESPLAEYLRSHSSRGWGPLGIVSSLRGNGSLNDRLLSTLSRKHIVSTVAGPQVLQVSYTGPTPAVAAGTLRVLLNQVEQESARLVQLRGQGALAYYKAQVDAASKAVADARQQIDAYVGQHGGVITPGDPVLKALRQAESGAGRELARTSSRLNQASAVLQAPVAGPRAAEVLDPPTLPTASASGKKKALLAIFAGLFAGGLVSFLALVALTPGRRDAESAEDDAPVRTHAPKAAPRARGGNSKGTRRRAPARGSTGSTNGSADGESAASAAARPAKKPNAGRRRRKPAERSSAAARSSASPANGASSPANGASTGANGATHTENAAPHTGNGASHTENGAPDRENGASRSEPEVAVNGSDGSSASPHQPEIVQFGGPDPEVASPETGTS
jgi:hypothetical protein